MKSFDFIRRCVFVAAALLAAATAFAGIPQKPVPPCLVNDFAGVFTASQVAGLESRLVAFDDTTSNQIAVVTVSDLEGYDPNEYAVEIGLKWQVGSKDFNNGVVLLVKPKNSSGSGKVSIQVGYGLEGAITDANCKRIIEEILIPAFREDDYYGGVSKACEKLMGLANGEVSVKREFEESPWDTFVPLIFFLLMMALFIYAGSKGGRKGGSNNSGGGSGNKRVYVGPLDTWLTILGSGGGFGGGRSGGFGGGGFGGFGGGSFGGGGASGSW